MHAIGISVHTGWGACVIVGGSLREPEIVSNSVINILEDAERFCFHRASEMRPELVPAWLTSVRAKALAKARSSLLPVLSGVRVGAIVARDGMLPALDAILAAHMRIHSAEGIFYRDVFREACQIPCHIVPPASLSVTEVGKLAASPWGKDQKLAALAAWRVLGVSRSLVTNR